MSEFYGIISVSDKGQIAIPVSLRKELDIKTGDRFIIMKRKDGAGIVLLKTEKMDSLLEQIRDDEKYFNKK